jgi:hypothetical protein
MPVILATWEAEIRRIVVGGQPRAKISQDPISTNSWHSGTHLQKTEIRRIKILGQPGQKNL